MFLKKAIKNGFDKRKYSKDSFVASLVVIQTHSLCIKQALSFLDQLLKQLQDFIWLS
jgi:hypothetical protein